MNTRSRSWCLTHNNYTENDIIRLEAFLENQVEYGIYGKEVGESGTPHLQLYFRMKNAKTFQKIKKLFPESHIEVAKGNDEQNFKYCSKQGDYKEYGQKSRQGYRTDLEGVKEEILLGKKVDEICLENPFLYHEYGRTFQKIEDIRMRKVFRTEMTEGYWIWGETGSGKSEYVFKDFDPERVYVWKYDNGWNDGYAQQDKVILDEFRGQLPMNELLMMIDKHPNYYVRRRGREPLPFTSKQVYITSSMPPSEVYSKLSENDKLDQLFRRIKIIKLERNS